jgi:hypothetical protein
MKSHRIWSTITPTTSFGAGALVAFCAAAGLANNKIKTTNSINFCINKIMHQSYQKGNSYRFQNPTKGHFFSSL